MDKQKKLITEVMNADAKDGLYGQTAVEWLEITVRSISVGRASIDRYKLMILKLIEQAKQMEREQIINARVTAPLIPTSDKNNYIEEAEQYYNNTYNK